MPPFSISSSLRRQTHRPPEKSGGIRPIAIGNTWRWLAAKYVNKYAISMLDGNLITEHL
jgi:hypothetical protein